MPREQGRRHDRQYQDLTATGRAIDQRLVADADVPLSQGVQRQGDILITPLPRRASAVLEQSQATANTHLLVGDGTWSPATTGPDLGIVHVATAAYLLHPEHAALGIGAGRYRLRRQREHTDRHQDARRLTAPRHH